MAKQPDPMSDTMHDAARQTRDTAGAATDQMRDAADRMKAAGGAMADNGSQLGMKMLDQAETNTLEAFRAMRAAAQANDLGEVMRIQSSYMRDQGSRSVAQAREIGDMIAEFGRTAMGQMTGRK